MHRAGDGQERAVAAGAVLGEQALLALWRREARPVGQAVLSLELGEEVRRRRGVGLRDGAADGGARRGEGGALRAEVLGDEGAIGGLDLRAAQAREVAGDLVGVGGAAGEAWCVMGSSLGRGKGLRCAAMGTSDHPYRAAVPCSLPHLTDDSGPRELEEALRRLEATIAREDGEAAIRASDAGELDRLCGVLIGHSLRLEAEVSRLNQRAQVAFYPVSIAVAGLVIGSLVRFTVWPRDPVDICFTVVFVTFLSLLGGFVAAILGLISTVLAALLVGRLRGQSRARSLSERSRRLGRKLEPWRSPRPTRAHASPREVVAREPLSEPTRVRIETSTVDAPTDEERSEPADTASRQRGETP